MSYFYNLHNILTGRRTCNHGLKLTYKSIIRWKKSGIIKRTKFINKLLWNTNFNFFRLHSLSLSEEILSSTILELSNQFDKLTTLLNSFYGDNWDYNIIKFDNKWVIQADILFDKVDIVNNEGENHSMKNLLITLQFNLTSIRDLGIFNIQGTRLTQTFAEAITGYLHSHLPQRAVNNFTSDHIFIKNNFCYGSGTEMSNFFDDFYTDGKQFNIDELEIFLYNLQSFVEYESLEGSPYIRMKRISNLPPNTDTSANRFFETHFSGYDNLSFINDLIYYLNTKISLAEVPYTLSGNIFLVDITDAFLNLIKLHLSHDSAYHKYLIQIDPEQSVIYSKTVHIRWSNSVDSNSIIRDLSTDQGPVYYYKDQEIKYRIEEIPTITVEENDINRFVVHPQVLSLLIKYYENELFRKAIRYSNIHQEN